MEKQINKDLAISLRNTISNDHCKLICNVYVSIEKNESLYKNFKI